MRTRFIISLLTALFISNITFAQSFSWGKTFGGKSFDIVNSCATDIQGNVYLAGYFRDTTDFDPGPGTFLMNSDGSDDDAYILKLDSTGNFKWAQRFGSTANDIGVAVATAPNGDVFFAGSYFGTLQIETTTLPNNGAAASYIIRMDSLGNIIWIKNFRNQSGGTTRIQSLAADATGAIYLTGYFNGTILANPNDNSGNLIAGTGTLSGFVSKLDANGDFIWAKPLLSDYLVDPRTIAVDASFNVYVAGNHTGTTDFDPSNVGEILDTSNSFSQDIFLLKLSASGDFAWYRSIGSEGAEFANDIILDDASNIYLTGSFTNTADFSENGSIVLSSGQPTIYVAKFNTNGTTQWAYKLGGDPIITAGTGRSIDIDTDGNIYLTGEFSGNIDFNPGSGTFEMSTVFGASDGFVVKLSAADASFIWARRIGGPNQQDLPKGIAVYGSDLFYVVGNFTGTTNLDPMGNVPDITATSPNFEDVFIVKYSNASLTSVSNHEYHGKTFVIYPNPANNFLMINTQAEASIKFYSIDGKIIKGLKIISGEAIDVSDLIPGVYIISITQSEQTENLRFIKH